MYYRFCAYNKDDEQIFLAPLIQCCTLRQSTYKKLSEYQLASLLTERLTKECNNDPIAPLLHKRWYPTLERRLKIIMATIIKCGKANGGLQHVLV